MAQLNGSFNITDYANATADISLDCDSKLDVVLLLCVAFLSYVFGIPGAVVVLLDMFQKLRKGTSFTPNDVFVSNLTVMDALFLLFAQHDFYAILFKANLAYDTFITFLYSFNLCGRPLFLVCIALDCYLAVVHPVTYRARKSLTSRILMAVGVWLLTLYTGCHYTIFDDYTPNEIAQIYFFIWSLPIIGFCDLSILWTLKRSSPGGKDIHPQKKKAVQIIVNNLVFCCLSYFPPIVSTMLSYFLSFDKDYYQCNVLIPMIRINVIGTIVSVFLQLNNLGKLDWLKCKKLK